MGKLCIEVTPASKIAQISEELCIGCGICVKKCPFAAISIINLPKDLERDTTHRYGQNSFKLHRLPVPRPGQVLGLVGTNGIGKSTALKVLAGKLKPNLGKYEQPPDWADIITYFRGSELQNYFTKILEDNLKAIIKPQYVDAIPKAVKGNVQKILSAKDERKVMDQIIADLELGKVLEREVGDLSGGELQRMACGVVCVQQADIYMFDEPSSYLDVQQRLRAARVIRSLLRPTSYVIVVEHDLAVLDYLSDFICCLYGVPGAYGVVTLPFSVREGINIFLAGFIPTENLRFRDFALSFKMSENTDSEEEVKKHCLAEDMQVLTEEGFMFLSDLEAYQRAHNGALPLVAAYDHASGYVRYERPIGDLIIKPRGAEKELIELTDDGSVPIWGPDADEYGFYLTANGTRRTRSLHISLRVTPDHDLFTNLGKISSPHTRWERVDGTWQRGKGSVSYQFQKVKAEEVATKGLMVRLMTYATEGLQFSGTDDLLMFNNELDPSALLYRLKQANETCTPASVACAASSAVASAAVATATANVQGRDAAANETLNCATALEILARLDVPQPHTKAKALSVMKLYGFWVGDGYLDWRNDCAVAFSGTKPKDRDWLISELEQLGYVHGVHFKVDSSDTSTRYYVRVITDAWKRFFEAEYMHIYIPAKGPFDTVSTWRGSYLAPERNYNQDNQDDHEHRKSSKWFAYWVWKLLAPFAAGILAGAHLADGRGFASKQTTIYTSSARFRDELIRLAMHAGYTAFFDLAYKAGTVRGERNGKPIVAHSDGWSVNYTGHYMTAMPVLEPSELRRVSYDGRTWCLSMPSGTLIARRAVQNPTTGAITKASRATVVGNCRYQYPEMVKTFKNDAGAALFKLSVKAGEFTDSEIVVLLGQNGTGKTTFIRMLAGLVKADSDQQVPELNVSYKPQKISPKFDGTVRQLLQKKIKDTYLHPQFVTDVTKPLNLEQVIDQEVTHLSGGELQRVAIILCLGQPADIYLIDEPSAYLDSEQRIIAAKVIKRFILHAKKTAFVVEHDFIMATYLADRVIVYEGEASVDCIAHAPQTLLSGINVFLKQLQITFRRDPTNFRPRINKLESVKDKEQKLTGSYFFLDE